MKLRVTLSSIKIASQAYANIIELDKANTVVELIAESIKQNNKNKRQNGEFKTQLGSTTSTNYALSILLTHSFYYPRLIKLEGVCQRTDKLKQQ